MNRSKKKFFFIFLTCLSFIFTPLLVLAETNNKKNGEILYAENCAECHSLSLRGSSHGNELIGRIFIEKWQNKFELLFSVIANTMPPGNNHKISNSDYLEILSYILNKNNIKNINLTNIVDISDEEEWVSFSDPSTIDRPEDR